MGDMIRVDFNTIGDRDLGDLETEFRLGSSRVRGAAARAINRSLGHMRSLISQSLRDIYYVKKEQLDAGIRLNKARSQKIMGGSLTFRGFESPPLSLFSPRQDTKKTSVSVKVLKAHRARRIQPGGEKKIIATSRGRAAVWLAKGQIMARTEGAKRPIVLYGPSFMAFFRRPNVVKALNIEAEAFFERRLRQELRFFLVGDAIGETDFGKNTGHLKIKRAR